MPADGDPYGPNCGILNHVESGGLPGHKYANYLGKGEDYGTSSGDQEWYFRIYSRDDPGTNGDDPSRSGRLSAYLFNRWGGLGNGAGFQPGPVYHHLICGEWYQIAATYDSGDQLDQTARVRLYVNDLRFDDQAGSYYKYSSHPVTTTNGDAAVRLGTVNGDSSLDATFDELSIYNRALTYEQVRSLYLDGTRNLATTAGEYLLLDASSTYEGSGWGLSRVADGSKVSTEASMGYSSALKIATDHVEWLEVIFQQSEWVSHVALFPRTDGAQLGQGFPVDFKIQVWNGTTWVDRVVVTGYPKPSDRFGEVFTWQCPPGTGGDTTRAFTCSDYTNRIRIYATSLRPNNSEYAMQFSEIQVF